MKELAYVGLQFPADENVIDESIAIAEEVVMALARDPRTTSARIEVVYDRGVLTLMGEVEDESIHKAAEEVAYQNENVLTVQNALEVRPKEGVVDVITHAFADMFM